MIFRSSKKHDEQNELIKNNNDNIMNINKLKFRTVKFEESVVKNKKRNKDNNKLIMFTIKNVKLANVLCRMIKQNFTYIIQKMLHAVVFNIIVENILTSEFIIYKLMFKSEKSDLIIKIFKTEKVNVNNVKTHCIINILYFSASSCAVIDIEDK